MDSLSFSNTNEKLTQFENTEMSTAYITDKLSRNDDTISNERIQNGDIILDTYEVTSNAILGGMGSVWRVHHNSWNTDLAMKRPQPRFFAESGDEKKAQFVSECENWINLGLHPNIVSCYYVREIGGVPTIFSEWMDGGSLSDRIKDGSLYEGTEDEIQERILDIAIQAARGLQYSHENGLIHQDFKPGNLLLTKEWDAKVADFGLAKAKSNLDDKSDTAKTTGYTLAYCPQEQVDREEPQKWMDVYSWALTVLEMYAGKRLWQTGAEAKAHFEEYPAQCAHTIPDKMKKVLKECLINKPDGFAERADVLPDIYRRVAGEDYPRKVTDIAELADQMNNKALSFLDLGLVDEAETTWSAALNAAPEHLTLLYNYGLFKWRLGQIDDDELLKNLQCTQGTGPVRELSNRLIEQVNGERGIESVITKVTDENSARFDVPAHREAQKETKTEYRSNARVLVSPDGKLIYYIYILSNDSGSRNTMLVCRKADTLELVYQNLIDRSVYVSNVYQYLFILSNDGKTLIMGIGAWITIIDAVTGKELKRSRLPAKNILFFHPDGRYAYAADEDGRLIKWDYQKCAVVRTGQIEIHPEQPKDLFGKFGWDFRVLGSSPDGRYVYALYLPEKQMIRWRDDDEESLIVISKDITGTWELPPVEYMYKDILFLDEVNSRVMNGVDLSVWKEERCNLMQETHGKRYGCMWLDPQGNYMLTIDDRYTNDLKVLDQSNLRCICTFPTEIRPGIHTYVSVSADNSMDTVAVGGGSGDALMWYGMRNAMENRVSAPWELCEIKTLSEVDAFQKEAMQTKADIDAAIEARDIEKALRLYSQAEHKYEFRNLWRSYRELARYCEHGKGVYCYEYKHLSGQFATVNPDGSRIAVVSPKSKGYAVELYTDDFEEIACFDIPCPATDLRFSDSGRLLAVALESGACIWDMRDNKLLRQTKINIGTIQFSPDEKLLLFKEKEDGWNQTFGLYDFTADEMSNWVKPTTIFFGERKTIFLIEGICFSPDGESVFACGLSETKTVPFFQYDLKNKSCHIVFENEYDTIAGSIHSFHPSLAGDRYIVAEISEVHIYDAERWEIIDTVSDKELQQQHGTKYWTGRFLAVNDDRGIGLWDFDKKPQLIQEIDFSGKYHNVSASEDGNIVAVSTDDTVHVFALKRELRFPGWKNWDEKADNYFKTFVKMYPDPNEEQIQSFVRRLQHCGFGYITLEGVTDKIRNRQERIRQTEENSRALSEIGELIDNSRYQEALDKWNEVQNQPLITENEKYDEVEDQFDLHYRKKKVRSVKKCDTVPCELSEQPVFAWKEGTDDLVLTIHLSEEGQYYDRLTFRNSSYTKKCDIRFSKYTQKRVVGMSAAAVNAKGDTVALLLKTEETNRGKLKESYSLMIAKTAISFRSSLFVKVFIDELKGANNDIHHMVILRDDLYYRDGKEKIYVIERGSNEKKYRKIKHVANGSPTDANLSVKNRPEMLRSVELVTDDGKRIKDSEYLLSADLRTAYVVNADNCILERYMLDYEYEIPQNLSWDDGAEKIIRSYDLISRKYWSRYKEDYYPLLCRLGYGHISYDEAKNRLSKLNKKK